MSDIQSVKSDLSFETNIAKTSLKSQREPKHKVSVFDTFAAILKRFFKRVWYALSQTFREFCAITSIHGFRHLNNSMWYEKILFNVFIFASIGGCILIMGLVRFERVDNPIIVSYNEKSMTVKDIPFPAITVCPQVKASHKKFDCAGKQGFFMGNMIKDQDMIEKFVAVYRGYCNRVNYGPSYRGWLNPTDIPVTRPFVHHLQEIALQEEDLISDCENNLSGVRNNCTWTQIMNLDGVCFTFNMIDSQDLFYQDVIHQYKSHRKGIRGWIFDDIFRVTPINKLNERFPTRTEGFSDNYSLKFKLKYNKNDSINVCKYQSHTGFNIYIHNSLDFPYDIHHLEKVSTNMNIKFDIIPRVTMSDPSLRSAKPQKRKCLFQQESPLTYFKRYTQNNCELECYSKFSQEKCRCTEFWIPANASDNKICGNGTDSQAYCWMNGLQNILTDDQIRLSLTGTSVCNCWPSCFSTEYDVERTVLSHDNSRWNRDKQHEYTELQFQFKNFEFKPLKREQLHGDLDFIADIGELLSLFIGTSVLSLIELLFFCTLGFIKHFTKRPIVITIDYVGELSKVS